MKVTQLCLTLRPHGLYSPWNSPGWNTGVGSPSLLQGIFPTQGLNPGLSQSMWILYHLSHKGSPRILEWVVYSFSSGSSWFRNWTGVSCIASGFFTNSYQGSLRVTEWLLLNTKWTTAELLMSLGEGGLSLCLSCLCGQQKKQKATESFVRSTFCSWLYLLYISEFECSPERQEHPETISLQRSVDVMVTPGHGQKMIGFLAAWWCTQHGMEGE